MFYTVYKVTNDINGKFYIGTHKTNDINDDYMGSGKYLKRSQEKHGIENFTKEILYIYDNAEEMFAKEVEIVNEDFLAEENTYNLKVGGSGGFDYVNKSGKNIYYDENGKIANGNPQNFIPTADIILRMKREGKYEDYIIKIKKSLSEYYKEHVGSFLGKKHSDESKRKISEANKLSQLGNKNSQYGTMWIYNLELQESKKISKAEEIPEGWLKGRKLRFNEQHNSHVLEMLENKKVKKKEGKVNELRLLHDDYIIGGFEKVKQNGYKYSQTNLVAAFERHLTEFVPQNGKRRKEMYNEKR